MKLVVTSLNHVKLNWILRLFGCDKIKNPNKNRQND